MEARRWAAASIAIVVLAGPWTARAQEERPLHEPPQPWVQRIRAQALGGVQLFPGAASPFVGDGIAYGLVIGWKPFWLGGIELGYLGARYKTSEITTGPVTILENGAQLILRVSPRFGILEPYALAGGAFSIVTVRSDEGVKKDLMDDTLIKVPLGVGLDLHMQPRTADPTQTHVVLGVRGVYQLVFFNDFVPVTSRGADQIAATFLLGVDF